ncbi:hypothetical protein PGT21_000726 [Puccinia graminis f. sp. tritici]|uniref:RNA helicase n=1 Tax=Puccinia graminis f. sp. tritici TaxID=56615 RepID=A0A5B0LSJ7_PUCGR|nr:hypothetical protein PGT21_000726 [Puccinia graminis f. sp. tritici]
MASDESPKRRRLENNKDESGDESDGYVPYVPVKKRKEAELHKLLDKKLSRKADTRHQHTSTTSNNNHSSSTRETNRRIRGASRGLEGQGDSRENDSEDEEEQLPSRSTTTLLQEAQVVKRKQAELDAFKTEAQKKLEEEHKVIEAIAAQKKKLGGAQELAKGVQYTEPMRTSWSPPGYIRNRTAQENSKLRERLGILVEGDNCPPPIEHFQDMRLPSPVLKYLKEKKIKLPTPIQLQGLPVALSGRDMIGIAFTGSGKTLAFSLPLLLLALEAEMKLHSYRARGCGIIVCPSVTRTGPTDLRRPSRDGSSLCPIGQVPTTGTLLCIGGISMADQSHVMSKGFHMVVATPGRLQDMLEKRKFNLDNCTYLCLDEADRMVDMGFEDDRLRRKSLVQPIVVNVGRAGAANLDVIQEVEYVKQEAKMVYLLECLQKTPPPVIIFSDNKNEVDDIQEYLLLKGVEAVAIHGSKIWEEGRDGGLGGRLEGAGFCGDPARDQLHDAGEIENYVHQIGRTGRSGKTGIATTFINMNSPEPTLLDLKYLLLEAKQRIPQFLQTIEDPNAGVNGGANGCQFCGGLGHSALNCPKREDSQRRERAGHHREDGAGGGY